MAVDPWWKAPDGVDPDERSAWFAAVNEVNDLLGKPDLVPMSHYNLNRILRSIRPAFPERYARQRVAELARELRNSE